MDMGRAVFTGAGFAVSQALRNWLDDGLVMEWEPGECTSLTSKACTPQVMNSNARPATRADRAISPVLSGPKPVSRDHALPN